MIDSKTKPGTPSGNILLIGVKTGKCDICKATKRVLLLKYGFTLCEECFNVCTFILQEIQDSTTNQEANSETRGKKHETTILRAKNSRQIPPSAKLHRLESKGSEA